MTTTEAGEHPAQGRQKPQFIDPVSQTIALLPTEIARLYTNLHPVLILGPIYLFFPHLVQDPVTTLSWTILPLALLQSAYCTVCLPPSSGSSTPSIASKTPKKKRVQFAKQPPTTQSKLTTAAISLFLTFSLGTPLLLLILIAFGAPFTTHFSHNVLCATHMALLGVLPLFYVHGVSSRMWHEISGAFLPFDEVWGGTVGTMVGAWLGAIPIPLDWDRDWQNWPITIVIGAYLGWATFRLLGAYVLHGKRVSFEE